MFPYFVWQVYWCLNDIDSGRLLPSQMPNSHAIYPVKCVCIDIMLSAKTFMIFWAHSKVERKIHLKWVFSCLIYFSHPFWAFLGSFVKSDAKKWVKNQEILWWRIHKNGQFSIYFKNNMDMENSNNVLSSRWFFYTSVIIKPYYILKVGVNVA